MNTQSRRQQIRIWTGALALWAVMALQPALRSQAQAPELSILPPELGANASLLYDGSVEWTTGEDGREQMVVRRNVRVVSDDMDIRCDLLIHDKKEGVLKAWPAVGLRVEVAMSGMRAECGYLEYLLDKGQAILRRNPVVFQKDKSGRELETRGHLITMTRNAQGQPRVLVQSKKSPAPGIAAPVPATLIVDEEGEVAAIRGQSPAEWGRVAATTGAQVLLSPDDIARIPLNIREESRPRPGQKSPRR